MPYISVMGSRMRLPLTQFDLYFEHKFSLKIWIWGISAVLRKIFFFEFFTNDRIEEFHWEPFPSINHFLSMTISEFIFLVELRTRRPKGIYIMYPSVSQDHFFLCSLPDPSDSGLKSLSQNRDTLDLKIGKRTV